MLLRIKAVEYYGKEASKYTTKQLEGKTVYLEYDTKKEIGINIIIQKI